MSPSGLMIRWHGSTISGTVGCLAKFNSTGNNVQDSIACESGGTITITGNLTVTGTTSWPKGAITPVWVACSGSAVTSANSGNHWYSVFPASGTPDVCFSITVPQDWDTAYFRARECAAPLKQLRFCCWNQSFDHFAHESAVPPLKREYAFVNAVGARRSNGYRMSRNAVRSTATRHR